MTKSITFVGLDVHKNSIAVALADAGRNAEMRNYGIIGGDLDDLHRLVKKLATPDREPHFVYEAAPCGYEIFRSLTAKGFDCAVCSPARMTRLIGKRQEGVSQEVRDIAWECQVRLCARFCRLLARGKSRNTVVTAIARELAAFMWAIANKTPITR